VKCKRILLGVIGRIAPTGFHHTIIPTFHLPTLLLILGLLVIALAFVTCGEEEEEPSVENARALYDKKNYDEAIAKYKEILEDQPDNVEALVGLSWAYLKNNNPEEAKKQIEDAITQKKLDKSNLEANVVLLGVYLVSSHSEINRFKLAIKAAQTVLEKAPDDYVSQYDKEIDLNKIKLTLAQAYLYDGQIDQAQKQMSELSEKDLTDLEVLIDEISNLSGS